MPDGKVMHCTLQESTSDVEELDDILMERIESWIFPSLTSTDAQKFITVNCLMPI